MDKRSCSRSTLKFRFIKLAIICLFSFSSFLHAESFILHDKTVLEGELQSQNEKGITVKIPYGTVFVNWQELSHKTIRRINPDLLPKEEVNKIAEKSKKNQQKPYTQLTKEESKNNTQDKLSSLSEDKVIKKEKKEKLKSKNSKSVSKVKPLLVTTKDGRIYVNGKLFFIKGICYSPFYPGKGFGKNAYKFIDVSIKEKDFQMMKEAGFNTIRLYESMPPEFYEYALKYGLKIIEPVIYPGTHTNIDAPDTLYEYKSAAIRRVKSMKNNPTILMWSLWNDAPFQKPNIIEQYGERKVNEFFKEIYDEIKKIDKNHPVTGANMIKLKNGGDMGFKFLDVIGCNSYIGLDYNNSGWEQANFDRMEARKRINMMRTILRKFQKPVFITETGCHTFVQYDQQGKVIEKQIKLIGEKLAGFCIFEWTDEWWKGGKSQTQDFHVEDHWGILDAYRKPKPAFEVIKKYFNMIPTESKGFNTAYMK